MYHQQRVRKFSLLFTILLAATTTTTSTAASSPSKNTECITSRSSELAEVAACGHKETLRECFSNPEEYGWAVNAQAQDLKICFLDAGCTPEAAQVEAEWTIHCCNQKDSMDLRKRRDSQAPIHELAVTIVARTYDSMVPTPTPTPTAYLEVQEYDLLGKRQDQTPKPTGKPELLPDFQLFKCYSTAKTTENVCTTATAGGGTQCTDVARPYYKCRDGMICRPDAAGLPGCLESTNKITTDGLVVAILLGTAVLAATIAICACCIRDRNERRRLRQAAEMAAVQRDVLNDALKQRPTVDVRSIARTDGAGYAPPLPGAQQDPFSDNEQYHGRR